jgi:hypothetical protein
MAGSGTLWLLRYLFGFFALLKIDGNEWVG